MVNAIGEEEELSLNPLSHILGMQQTVHVNQLDEKEQRVIGATQTAAIENLPSTDPAGAPSLEGRVEPMDLTAQNEQISSVLENLASQAAALEQVSLESEAPFVFLNLNPALDLINLGLLKERQVDDQLQMHIKKIEKQQSIIDLLIKLNTALSSHKEGEELSAEMKEVVAKLKEEKIDLLKEGEITFSKERISELKPVISSHTDNLRTAIQITFTTQIQVLTNMIGLVMDILKKAIDYNNKLISAANRLPGH